MKSLKIYTVWRHKYSLQPWNVTSTLFHALKWKIELQQKKLTPKNLIPMNSHWHWTLMWSFSVACPLLYSLPLKKGPLTKDKFVNKIRIKITVDEMKSEIHENQQWWTGLAKERNYILQEEQIVDDSRREVKNLSCHTRAADLSLINWTRQ